MKGWWRVLARRDIACINEQSAYGRNKTDMCGYPLTVIEADLTIICCISFFSSPPSLLATCFPCLRDICSSAWISSRTLAIFSSESFTPSRSSSSTFNPPQPKSKSESSLVFPSSSSSSLLFEGDLRCFRNTASLDVFLVRVLLDADGKESIPGSPCWWWCMIVDGMNQPQEAARKQSGRVE